MNLLRKYIRGLLIEDAAKRKAFAQDMRDRGLGDRSASRSSAAIMSGDDYREMIQIGRPLKQLFAKHADRAFLDSLITVHWASVNNAMNLLKSGSSRDELSASAYLPGQLDTSVFAARDVGVVIKGHITLLANDMDDVLSGGGQAYREVAPERTKMSGANKGVFRTYDPDVYEMGTAVLVFDREDWKPAVRWSDAPHSNEALVDNWQVTGLIVPDTLQKTTTVAVEMLALDVPVMTPQEATGAL